VECKSEFADMVRAGLVVPGRVCFAIQFSVNRVVVQASRPGRGAVSAAVTRRWKRRAIINHPSGAGAHLPINPAWTHQALLLEPIDSGQ
jgi:hypothetical protein